MFCRLEARCISFGDPLDVNGGEMRLSDAD
jgi:hypothetical protein